ncbi:hypothetical protein OESDEN_20699 [Oesophagostomum dentatum]|uniref:Uncharacterized protein n=1 Tax=Oesophagostomum dentatum TaxID=61180 RepID=A0A0B1S422_OESDE|nr:hypothetical protein OESDEN_20699 [Oesophagostomum dentatum]
MRAFYSSSEEFNSPDEWETRKSAEEEERQVGAEESDDERASLVDKLFEMLEEAEESVEEEAEEDENDVTLVRDAQSTPRASPRSSPRQFIPQYQEVAPAQAISAAGPQYPVPRVIPEYVVEPLPPQVAAYGPSQAPYPQTMEFEQGVQNVEQQPFLSGPGPAPALPLAYAQPTVQPGYQLPPPPPNQYQQPAHQYFRPIPPEYLSQPQINRNLVYPQVETVEAPVQPTTSTWVAPAYGQPVQPAVYSASARYLDEPPQQEFIPQEPRSVPQPQITVKRVLEYPASSESESATESELWESVSVRQALREQELQDEEEAIQTEPRPKGPPFEQKGPTFNKEVKPVPAPPPPSPEIVTRAKPLEAMDRQSLIEQIANETDRLEEVALRQVSEYERQEQLDELRKKMCDRFKRFYPALFSDEEEGETDVEPKSADEEEDETGNGEVMRNGIQLAARYLALWFPDKKERKEMIPWNTLRKIKPIRLCFLDNRVGHGEYETFDIGEFVATTGHMMFAYGDGPEALDDTRLFVLDIVRQQMNMLLRRIWSEMVETHERRVFTYTHIFSLYKRHPIRLRRLVRYLVEQVRVRHMLYRVMADQGHRRGQDYFENRMGVNETGATEVLCLKKRAPHIYYVLEKLYPDQLDFLCEERRLQDCDPELTAIKMFLKRRNQHLSAEHKEILDYARRVSYCSRTGRL